MDIVIGGLLILSGTSIVANAIIKRRKRPAFHYFAKSSQEWHELQRRQKKF